MAVRYALMLTCVVLLGAWPVPGAAQREHSASALTEVRVQLKWAHQFQFAGFYAAVEKGFYRDVGLDVKLIEHSEGLTPIDQLIGGRVDFSVADSGALLYRSTGVPLVALAVFFQNSPSILICLESSGIRTLADIRGRRVMLGGGYLNAELLSMLQTAGIGVDDIQVQPSQTDPRYLIDGRTDAYNAYATNEPYFLSQQGISFVSFAPHDYGVDFYGDTLITTEARIASDPELVRDFRDATLKGWNHAVAHPEEVVDMILAKYNTQQKSRDHLLFEATEAIRLILPNVVPIGYMNEDRWRRIETTFRDQGHLSRSVDMSRFLYKAEDTSSAWEVLKRYRLEIAIATVVLIALLLLSHILRLRAQVRARTNELEKAKLLAEVEARTDELTGLPNRRYFFEILARDIAQAQRHAVPLCVLSVDIDFFKTVNDRYGHAAGDKALQCASEILKRNARSEDIAARIGGEEFALACLNTSVAETRKLAERLRREMEATSIDYGSDSFRITLSIGLAARQEGDDVEQLLRKSDLALYEAKQSGRNRICEWHIHCTREPATTILGSEVKTTPPPPTEASQ